MIEERVVKVAKEFSDVNKFVVELIRTIKEKGDYAAVVPKLIAAVDGVGDIDDEFKDDMKVFIQTGTHDYLEILDVFLKKKEE